MFLRLLLALPLVFTVGCTTLHKEAPKLVGRDGSTLDQTRYHAQITAADGKRIAFTVWQPALRRGQTAPLIIHAHGFALTRMNSKFDAYAQILLAGKTALSAWEQGYWVISIDQRGHGKSQGKVGLIEWDKEVADLSRIIDWAQQNLALTTVDGDPKIGMIGESYGGGIQLLGTVNDPRIDALIPLTTWYDLEQALIPDGVPKSDWAIFLGAVTYTFNPFHSDGAITRGMLDEILFDDPVPELRRRLHRNSLASHCEGDEAPHADALLIQGFRDVLFPVNDALKIRDCFRKAGRDVRIIATEYGHLAPTAQLAPFGKVPPTVWYMEPHVKCDGRQYNLRDVMLRWFDMKLRDRQMPEATVPRWCMTGDQKIDAAQDFPPRMSVEIPTVHVGSGVSGLYEWFMRPLDAAGNWFVPQRIPEDWAEPSNGWARPAVVPLLAVDGPTWVVGVPHVELDFSDTDRKNPILFLRLARWKPGSGMYHVLSQQVTPARGNGHISLDLNAVRAKLEKDEVLGLLVSGYNNQYRLAGSGWGTDASISGTIELPVTGAGR